MYFQVALVIGGIITVFTTKTLVPLPRGQVGSLVCCQAALVIGGITAAAHSENAYHAPTGPGGFSDVLARLLFVICGIIAVFTAKTLVPLPRGQVSFLVRCQVAPVIGAIITVVTAKTFVSLPQSLVGFLVFGQAAL